MGFGQEAAMQDPDDAQLAEWYAERKAKAQAPRLWDRLTGPFFTFRQRVCEVLGIRTDADRLNEEYERYCAEESALRDDEVAGELDRLAGIETALATWAESDERRVDDLSPTHLAVVADRLWMDRCTAEDVVEGNRHLQSAVALLRRAVGEGRPEDLVVETELRRVGVSDRTLRDSAFDEQWLQRAYREAACEREGGYGMRGWLLWRPGADPALVDRVVVVDHAVDGLIHRQQHPEHGSRVHYVCTNGDRILGEDQRAQLGAHLEHVAARSMLRGKLPVLAAFSATREGAALAAELGAVALKAGLSVERDAPARGRWQDAVGLRHSRSPDLHAGLGR